MPKLTNHTRGDDRKGNVLIDEKQVSSFASNTFFFERVYVIDDAGDGDLRTFPGTEFRGDRSRSLHC